MDLDVNKEFLIAIANNSITISTQLTNLISYINDLKIMDEKDIEEVKLKYLCSTHKLRHAPGFNRTLWN